MRTGRFITLLIVAILICVGAVIAYQRRTTSEPREKGGALTAGDLLLPKLLEKTESVAGLAFSKGKDTIHLVRGDSGDWKVESAGGFPADGSKIRQLAAELSEVRVTDVLTSKKEKHDKFGLAGETGERGTLVLSGKDGADVARVVLGNERQAGEDAEEFARGGGRFVRVGTDPHVYLVKENLYWIEPRVNAWVPTEIVSAPQNKIVDLSIDHNSTETLHLVKKGENLTLEKVDDGKREKPYEVSAAAGALSNLRLDSVFPAASTITKVLDFKTTYTARLSDGTIYTARSASSGGKNYITVRAACAEPVFSDSDKATTTALAAAQKAAEKAKTDVPEFNKKHSPWVYELTEWTAKNLVKKRSEMMEPKPAEEKKPETPGAAPGMPGASPGMPGAAPGMPGASPGMPATPGAFPQAVAPAAGPKPAGPKPAAEPGRSAVTPAKPGAKPGARPGVMAPSAKKETKPAKPTRPAKKP